ncbi:MAG: RecX family transcriptional regulator [Alphaproteobacteria bacterium]|nr:RecX family transcriptional regulator [Alphaproteobacteria bacterium]
MADSPPDEARLHEAALNHIARYATTRAGLLRVLERRIDRWARAAPEPDRDALTAARRAARAVVERLAALGAIDDAAFAASRARSLTRAGKSRQAIAAHLASRGVAAETSRAATARDQDTDLAAALAWAKRRRIGPFRPTETDADGRRKELGVLARAGFDREVALLALACPAEEAEARVIGLKRS